MLRYSLIFVKMVGAEVSDTQQMIASPILSFGDFFSPCNQLRACVDIRSSKTIIKQG